MSRPGGVGSKGKGKTRPRTSQAEPSEWRLTAISHEDAQHGEVAGDPAPRCSFANFSQWCTYSDSNSRKDWYSAFRLVEEAKPVLFKESEMLRLADDPDLESLLPVFEAGLTKTYQIRGLPGRLMLCDAGKNIYGSPYHIREPLCSELNISVMDFFQCSRTWKSKLLALVCTFQRDGDQDPKDRIGIQGQLPARLQKLIHWESLSTWLQAHEFGRVDRLHLFSGMKNTTLPAQYQGHNQLFMQIKGRCRIFLMDPSLAFRGLYPFPVHHGYDGYSMVDFEKLDLGMWPLGSKVTCLKAVLHPGDVLFVPNYWFVHVEVLTPEALSLKLDIGQGARPLEGAAAGLHLSRILEERVAAVEGPQVGVKMVRDWILRIAQGREYETLDLATPKGYKRIVLCQEIRDDAEAVLGRSEWQNSLLEMCDGRLQPTEWLNKDFEEPLYLTDVPIRIEDDRTEEERRFPELFRHKLRAAGWSVPESRSTIPIPGYNVPSNYAANRA